MSEPKPTYTTAVTVVLPTVDNTTFSGVKCTRVVGAQPWRERIVSLLEEMQGPHPRWAIVMWDGTAYQFREAKNIAQRIAVE